MMLSHELMGLFALSVLWVTTVLIAWVGVRDMFRVAQRWRELRGRVHRGQAAAPIAVHIAEQVGRAQSASSKRRAIFFRDRSYRSDLRGGEVVLSNGERVTLPAVSDSVQVWLRPPHAPPPFDDFADAYAQALRPKGLAVTHARQLQGRAWIGGELRNGALTPLPSGWLVADFDPRRFCVGGLALAAAVLTGIVACSALVTILVLVRPHFGAVSTFGGVLGLAEFLLIQPLATWLRDRMLWPHEASVETRWLEPA